MHPVSLNWDPPKRYLRSAAWLVALALAVIGEFYQAAPAGWALRLAAAAIFAIGTVLPRTLRWPYVALLVVIYPLLWIMKQTLPPPPNPVQWKTRPPRERTRRSVRPA